MDQLLKPNVLNIHLTDKCNFCCKHCFVKKEGYELDYKLACLTVDKFKEYLTSNNISNGRISLAGGEPLLYKHLLKLIDYIYSKGIEISIITNGFYINDKLLKSMKEKVSTIGVSVDAINDETNLIIGRCTRKIEYLNLNNLSLITKFGLKLKINVCLNQINKDEPFELLFDKLQISRLKFFQMQTPTGINELSEEEFIEIANKYKKYNPVIETKNKMTNSYLVLDSKGNVSCNNSHSSHISILENDFDKALMKLQFDIARFNERY